MLSQEHTQEVTAIRHYLHQHPELSLQEYETTRYIQDYLTNLGIPYWNLGTPTGVIAELGDGNGPTIALRADMDALPITEQTNLPYQSNNTGVMHACGHDFHTASLLMATKLLKEREHDIHGTLRLLFQPAEELNKGARALIQEGVLEDVDAIIGYHNKPELPVGTVGIKEGPLMAAVGQFAVTIKGVGTHAAAPHNGNDPIVTAAQIITALQAVVSRHISPLHPVVLSIAHIEGGKTWNVIPETVFFEGTLRTFYQEDQDKMKTLFDKIVTNTAQAYDQQATIDWTLTPPVVMNDTAVTAIVAETTSDFATIVTPELTLGAEDFANYQEHVPGCFAFIGTGSPYEWHHPSFLVDDAALSIAVEYFVSNSFALLDRYKEEL